MLQISAAEKHFQTATPTVGYSSLFTYVHVDVEQRGTLLCSAQTLMPRWHSKDKQTLLACFHGSLTLFAG